MLQLGRQGQHYPIEEVAQGTNPGIAASNACRHKSITFNFDNKNKRTIVEKKQSPWTTTAQRTDGRKSGDWKYDGVLRPSGTLNTLPEVSPYLLAGFGAKTNVPLATTFTPAAPVASLVTTGAGSVTNGAHSFKWGFRSATGESLPSAASNPVTTDGTHNQVSLTAPLGPTGTTARVLYATEAAADPAVAANFKEAHVIANNTDATYVFDQADASLTKTLTGIVQVAGTATATLAGHGGAVGERVTISGADQAGYNITTPILTVPLTSTFTFAVDAGTVSPATGATISAFFNPPTADASGLITVSGGFVADVSTLAVNDAVLITCPDGKKRLRFLTAVSAVAVAWAPNLPVGQTPAGGAAFKGVITYKLTAANIKTLAICHYLKKTDGSAGLSRGADMCGVDKLSLSFDANDDPLLSASGPCREVVDPPAQPGGFTMVGSQPPSGITGDLMIGNVAMPFLKMSVDLSNGLWLRNDEYGVTSASELFRKSNGEVSIGLNCRAEDEATLYDLTEAGTNAGVFMQTGYVEGNCIAVRLPQVEFKVPGTDDPEEEVNWDFKGMGLESADAALDMLFVAIG